MSNIEVHEPGPLPDVALPGSKSMLLGEPSEENRRVIDVPSSENWAWIVITGKYFLPSKAVSDASFHKQRVRSLNFGDEANFQFNMKKPAWSRAFHRMRDT